MKDFLFHTKPELTPSNIEGLTGLTAATLRDWRHRRYIDKLGTLQPNGRWLYDWLDAFVLFILGEVSKSGFDITAISSHAAAISQGTAYARLRSMGYEIEWPQYFRISQDERFACSATDGPVVQGRWYGEAFSDFEERWHARPPASIVIDCSELSERMPIDFVLKFNELADALLKEAKSQGLYDA